MIPRLFPILIRDGGFAVSRAEEQVQIDSQPAPLEGRLTARGLTLPAAMVIANSAIFLFQIMLARITSPAVFGEGIAMLALLLLTDAPSSAIQALISGATQRSRAAAEGAGIAIDLGPLMLSALAGGLVCAAVLFPAVQLVNQLLHTTEPAILIAVYAIPVAIGTVPKGILAGADDRVSLATGLVLGAVVRLLAGTALVHSGYGLSGALAGVVIGEVTASFALVALARRSVRGGDNPLRVNVRNAMAEGLATTGFWCLAAVDLLASRHYLPASEAGQYAAAATVSELVMILPGAAAAILFPRLIGRRSERRPDSGDLARAVALVIAGSLVVAAFVEMAVKPILRFVFDSQYLPAAPAVMALLLSAAYLGVVTVLLQYLLSRGESVPASLSWLGAAGCAMGIREFHGSVGAIALVTACATASTAVGMFGVAIHGDRYVRDDEATRADLAQMGADLDLTVVVPYYNPGSALAPNIRRLIDVLLSLSVDFEVIAVSDGSTDGSDRAIAGIDDPRLHHVILAENQGKGAALQVGLFAGRGRYLGFIDADGDLDPGLLEKFVSLIKMYEPDLVMGSKRHPLSEVHYPPLRWMYSIGYQYLVRVLFRLNVRDTQTGIKVIRRDVLAATLPRMLEKRFAFDIELLAVARRLGYKRFLEAPVVIRQQFTSTVSIRSVGHTLLDTLAIFYRLRILRIYDRQVSNHEPGQHLRVAPPFVFLHGGAQLTR